MKSTMIFICAKDRVTCLRRLVNRLLEQGYANLVVIDTGSTYGPMLEYLYRGPFTVVKSRPGSAHPHHALWEEQIVLRAEGKRFVYTDGDVVPCDDCPDDWCAYLSGLLDKYPGAPKAGLGLKTSDLPDFYSRKANVIQWESKYNSTLAEPGVINSEIDTTLALYRDAGVVGLSPALRTTAPYLLHHLPWYAYAKDLSEEERHYRDHMIGSIGMWKP